MGYGQNHYITSTGWDWGPRVTMRSEHRDIGVFLFLIQSEEVSGAPRFFLLGGPVCFEWIEWRWLFFFYYNTFSLAFRVIHIECTSWFFHHMPEAHSHMSQIVPCKSEPFRSRSTREILYAYIHIRCVSPTPTLHIHVCIISRDDRVYSSSIQSHKKVM
jgi:hypothetical protein